MDSKLLNVISKKERDGWYTTHALEGIKTILRHKFFSLLEGYIVTDEDCRALLETNMESRSGRKHSFQARKHNMAKGALPPEDVAVCFSASLN